jgi:hypothetical protein
VEKVVFWNASPMQRKEDIPFRPDAKEHGLTFSRPQRLPGYSGLCGTEHRHDFRLHREDGSHVGKWNLPEVADVADRNALGMQLPRLLCLDSHDLTRPGVDDCPKDGRISPELL